LLFIKKLLVIATSKYTLEKAKDKQLVYVTNCLLFLR